MATLTPNQVNERNAFLLDCTQLYGKETVLEWSKDQRKVSIINALFGGQ